MIRSMMLVCAIGALGAVGCVAPSDAADESAVSQNTGGGGGLFDCQNNGSVSVVCTGDIAILNGLTVNIDKSLNGNQLNVLSGDLNNLKITDVNILDYNKILDDVEVVALNDFLTKFSIPVTKNDIDVCAVVNILGLQICK
jgi:hypothetical protein